MVKKKLSCICATWDGKNNSYVNIEGAQDCIKPNSNSKERTISKKYSKNSHNYRYAKWVTNNSERQNHENLPH